MKLSAKERVGLRAMVEFARHYGHGPISLTEVSKEQDLPLPYLEHVVSALRRSGLLQSMRGVHGGYTLAREPSAITVGDIFRAVEGTLLDSLECTQDGASCTRERTCLARNVWHRVSQRLSETLDNTTLADVV